MTLWSAVCILFAFTGISVLALPNGYGQPAFSWYFQFPEYVQGVDQISDRIDEQGSDVSTFHHDHDHDHHHDHHHDHGESPQEYGPTGQNGCSCLFFAENKLVYRSDNTTLWHSCTGWGLSRCGRYCETLFEDEDMRFRSRQNACDTLGREINVGWHRRHQVCGEYGPYEDILLRDDLCCQRGRPSDSC